MLGLSLLLGHLFGDYIVQGDWMAANKSNPRPLPVPDRPVPELAPDCGNISAVTAGVTEWADHNESRWAWQRGNAACLAHCLTYTLAVLLVCYPVVVFPWWFYAATFALHYPLDRFRLAKWWMTKVVNQAAFATGPLAPWSVVIVDNIGHLTVLYFLALAAGAK